MMTASALYELLLYLSVIVFAVVLAIYVRSGRASMFHPATIYLGFHATVFVVRPLLAFYEHFDFLYLVYGFEPSWAEKYTVILGANLGLVAFVVASLRFGRARAILLSTDSKIDGYITPLAITWVICGIPAAWSLISNWQQLGGSAASTMIMVQGTVINTTGTGYFTEAQLMLATLVGMFAYVFRFKWWSLLPFAAFVFLRAGSGGRGSLIAGIFFLVVLYLQTRRRLWPNWRATGVIALALLLFRMVGNDRGAATRGLLGYEVTAARHDDMRFLEQMDWANLEFFEYVVHVVPRRTGTYDYFLSMLQLVTEPIPRVLWSGKPIGAPVVLFNLFDYGNPVGMTSSLPGSGWVELGWAGIVIICVAFAWIYGGAYNRFMRSRQSPFAVLLYCSVLMTSIVAFRDGTVVTIFRQGIFYLAPVLLFGWLARVLGTRTTHPRVAQGVDPRNLESAGPPALTPKDRRKARAAERPQQKRSREYIPLSGISDAAV